ncbi:MAG: phosphonate ABC transporter, permease protein PhnE [Burkholderiales bacterium]|nr:phosphonate ABC transporter, permease protein PhnE [Burkholderiales bacterium]
MPDSAHAEVARWIRFTPAQRLARFAVFFGVVAAIAWALKTIEIIPEFLYDAPEQVLDMGRRMWPFDWEHFWPTVRPALVETLHIAAMATLLGLLMGIPVGFLAARNATPVLWLNAVARFILIATRSISTLIWALFFVAMFGPGPLAGALAIAFHSIGFIGKMFSEGVEEANRGSIEALQAAGATRMQQILMGYWPQVTPTFWSIALFRWDINVRESAVLGLVGAGGIGMALNAAIDLIQWERVSLILFTIFVVVILIEAIVTQIRKRVI